MFFFSSSDESNPLSCDTHLRSLTSLFVPSWSSSSARHLAVPPSLSLSLNIYFLIFYKILSCEMRSDQLARNETFTKGERERAREWMRERLRPFVIPGYHSLDIFNTFARSIPFASLVIRSFPYRLLRLTIELFYSLCRIIHRLAISLGSKSLPFRRWTTSRVRRARQLSILSITSSMLERWLNRSLISSE